MAHHARVQKTNNRRAGQPGGFPLLTSFENHGYTTGSTSRVSNVDVTNPPITTVASGRCTSAPADVASAIGTKPRLATNAVIRTGRNLALAPSITASAQCRPDSRRRLM